MVNLRGYYLPTFNQKLRDRYVKEGFSPTWLGLFINPFYFARKGLYKHVAELIVKLDGRLLDIGCGTKPYKSICKVDEYIGLEIDDEGNRQHKYANVFYDGKTIPFDDKYFDSLLCNQVFEHVFNPDCFLGEACRVLKYGGMALLSIPFVWDEHEQPHDFARYSSFGIRHMLENHGFDIVEQRKSMDDVRVIFQMINAYLYKKTVTRSGWVNLLLTLVLMAPFNVLGELLALILPKNEDLYLDNIVLARRIL